MLGSRKITRYVLHELWGPTTLGLGLYTFVLLMNHFFLVAQQALAKDLGAELTWRLFLMGIPKLLVLSIPMSVLLGALIGLGRLSADGEWLALQSAGLGHRTLLRPLLVQGLLASAACFTINAVVVPHTNFALRSLRTQIMFASSVATEIRPRAFYELPDDAVIYVDDVRAGADRLENVLLVQPDPERQGRTLLVLGKTGRIYPAPDGSGALLIDIEDGEAYSFRAEAPDEYRIATFTSGTNYRLAPPSFLKAVMATTIEKSPRDLTMGELRDSLRQARADRAALAAVVDSPRQVRLRMAETRLRTLKVELQRRFALPLACLCFVLLALPLGLTTARTGKGAGFALSVVVILFYKVVFEAFSKQATAGRVPPLAVWVADALVLVWALVAFWYSRPGGPRLANLLGRLRRPLGRTKASSELYGVEPARSDLVALGGSPRRFVGRLDAYIGRAYLRLFALALASTALIYLVFEGQEKLDEALRNRQALSLVGRYLVLFFPGTLPVVVPIACLIAAVVSITILARNSELVAITASGVSLRRLTAPILLLSLLISAAVFLLGERLAPAANRKAQALADRIGGRAARTYGLPAIGSWRFAPDGRTLYHFRVHDQKRDEYQGVSIFTLDRSVPRLLDQRYAERATYTPRGWQLGPGWSRSFGRAEEIDPETPRPGVVSTLSTYREPYLVELAIPRDVSAERRWLSRGGDDLSDQVSASDLANQIETLAASGYDVTRLRVAYHRKFAQALSPLVMALLGLPFAFPVGRRGSLYALGIALLLVLVYWATFAVFNALGLEAILPPALAAWAPNGLYTIVGLYLLLYVRT